MIKMKEMEFGPTVLVAKSKNTRRKTGLAAAIGAAMLLMGGTTAHAIDISHGEWTGSFDTTISYGIGFRAGDAEDEFLGKAVLDPYTFLLTNAEQRQTPGRWSVNNDLGNRNYSEAGDVVGSTVKFTSELDLSFRNYGVFSRFMGFYDFENESQNFLSDEAEQRVGADVRLLDLYIWGENKIGDRYLNWRLGRQVVSWGESTFIQGGINVINPVDVSRLRSAGSELKEAFEGVNMLYGSIDLTPSLSLEALYMFEYRKILPDPAGTYFSTNDIATPGASHVMLGFGTIDQPVINPDLYSDVCLDGNYANSDTDLPLNLVALSCSRSFPRDKSELPSNSGQYGLSLRYFAESLNSTEFGLFYINYHSRLPVISGTAITSTEFTSGSYRTEYPEDIHLFGASFNSNVGTWALSGEVSYRPNAPMQIDDVEILFAGLTPLNPLFPAPALQFQSQLGDFAPGEYIQGWARHDQWQGQMTTTKLFGPNNFLKADQIAFVAEAGINFSDIPAEKVLRYNGPGTDTGGGPDYLTGDLRNPITQTKGFADPVSWGYRMLVKADYNDVFASVTVSPRIAWAQDVSGTTPGPGGSFIDGRKTLTIGTSFNYLNRWFVDLAYTNYMGGGMFNLLSDRDFYEASVSYSF